MRIVYISKSTIPSRAANSIHVMKMCQAIAKLGNNVTLFAPAQKNTEVLNNNITVFNYYGVDDCFDILWIKFPPIKRFGLLYYGLKSALKAKKINPKVVYGRSLFGCLFSVILKKPVYYELHSQPRGFILTIITKFLFNNSNLLKVVLISHALKKDIEIQYPQVKEKIIVAPDAADPLDINKKIDSITLAGFEKLQVGYVGHLYSGRGIELIAEMAKTLEKINFHLVGGMEEDIDRWVNIFDGLNNVRFHGFIPPGEVGAYLNSFDVLLAPYQKKVSVYGRGANNTAGWMSPLKIFEYMSAGKPILCSDLPVLREVLETGKTAILLPPDDVSKWVDALEFVGDNPEKARVIGENAKKVFSVKYTWEARARMLLNVENR